MEEIKTNDLVESFSGVRGLYGKGINESLLIKYVFAYFAIFPAKKEKFLIAGDTRPSTEALKQAGIAALKQAGAKEIIDAGIVPIQAAELAIIKLGCSGGVYITASHNEPQYNGWKFLKEDGAILYAKDTQKIINIVHGKCKEPSSLQDVRSSTPYTPAVSFQEKQAVNLYCDYVLGKIGKEAVEKIRQSGLKIVLDPNGGSSIEILKRLAEKLNLKTKLINDKPGQFNRLVEPNANSLAYLQSQMAGDNFEFSAGLDCDGDRVEFVLGEESLFAKEMGPVVNGNYVLALACDTFLEGVKNQVVVVNDATSYLVREVIAKHGAAIKEVEVGETNVVEEMERQKCLIGGEGSNGGVIIPPIKCRDGIMTICLILKMLSQRQTTLSDILKTYPRYFSSHNKAACSAEKSLFIKSNLEDYYKKKGFVIKKTGDETGGLKAECDPNSFIWFRQSKTEPGSFRIYAETDQSQQKADDLAKEAILIFEKYAKSV